MGRSERGGLENVLKPCFKNYSFENLDMYFVSGQLVLNYSHTMGLGTKEYNDLKGL